MSNPLFGKKIKTPLILKMAPGEEQEIAAERERQRHLKAGGTIRRERLFSFHDESIVWRDKQGEFHRDNGPAVVSDDGCKKWYQHGKRHREDGPAMMNRDGQAFFWQDKIVSPEQHDLLAKGLAEIIEPKPRRSYSKEAQECLSKLKRLKIF